VAHAETATGAARIVDGDPIEINMPRWFNADLCAAPAAMTHSNISMLAIHPYREFQHTVYMLRLTPVKARSRIRDGANQAVRLADRAAADFAEKAAREMNRAGSY
jgi:hypothetical protein